jgi:hypothetical protein
MVIRYVISHINKDGMRVMTYTCQGRYTKATRKEAEQDLKDFLTNNTKECFSGVYGSQSIGTFKVSAIECYPKHFDPQGCYINKELNSGQQNLSEEMEKLFSEHDDLHKDFIELLEDTDG